MSANITKIGGKFYFRDEILLSIIFYGIVVAAGQIGLSVLETVTLLGLL